MSYGRVAGGNWRIDFRTYNSYYYFQVDVDEWILLCT